MAVVLPVEKERLKTRLEENIILVYGKPKIGKSTLCSQFESPIFLATEAGLNHLDVYKVSIRNWTEFQEACAEIAKGQHAFKTIIVDTIDNLTDMCNEHVCAENGIHYPGDLPMGKGWHLVTKELRRVIRKLSQLGYGVVFVSHCTQELIETKTSKYNKWTISVSGKNGAVYMDMADLILFIDNQVTKDGDEIRVIRTKPSMNWDAGDKSNILPATIPLNYAELKRHFDEYTSKQAI